MVPQQVDILSKNIRLLAGKMSVDACPADQAVEPAGRDTLVIEFLLAPAGHHTPLCLGTEGLLEFFECGLDCFFLGVGDLVDRVDPPHYLDNGGSENGVGIFC